MARTDLPPETYIQFPLQAAEARRVGPMEWSAATCPWCGTGKDRFHIFARDGSSNARVWCRKCNRFQWLNHKMTEQEREDIKRAKAAWREETRRQREERVKKLNEVNYWRGYHDGLKAAGRSEWLRRGVSIDAQNWFGLGYTLRGDGMAALTIPFHNAAWEVETVQYRMLGLEGNGKYRFEKGYPAAPFFTMPEPNGNPFIIVEGAIKAMVLWWTLCVQHNRPYNVVALPSKTPGKEISERLADDLDVRGVYLMLDPDATAAEQLRVGSHFDTCRYVATPFKIDDMIVNGFDPLDVEKIYLTQATTEPI